jgi:hypothetical protein
MIPDEITFQNTYRVKEAYRVYQNYLNLTTVKISKFVYSVAGIEPGGSAAKAAVYLLL